MLLLVDDQMQPAPGASPPVLISKDGGPFVATAAGATEIGAGWYAVQLTADELDTPGPLIVTAKRDDTLEWRDIIFVAEIGSAIDAEAIRQIVREEIAQWGIELAGPLKLIRTGAST